MILPLSAHDLASILDMKHNDEFLESVVECFNDLFPTYDITTKERIAAFISQCAHESVEFTRLKENTNYSASRLLVVFKDRVTPDLAKSIANKPEAIANHVYANKNGNGDIKSGDGFKYRGRGLIQLTGKANYERVGERLGLDLIARPELLENIYNATHSACVYWDENNINQVADTGDVMRVTKKINKAAEGLRERQYYYRKAMLLL